MGWRVAVALVAGLVLAGCGGAAAAPEIEFGAAAPSGEPIEVRVPKSGVAKARRWPNACTFLTDEEIVAILPQATEITREPGPVDVQDGGTAKRGVCDYEFTLPGDEGKRSIIRVAVAAVAAPEIVEQHFTDVATQLAQDSDKLQEIGPQLGAQNCVVAFSGTDIHNVCHDGPLTFEVRGASFMSQVDPSEETRLSWANEVLAEVIKTIAAKVG